MSKPSFLRKATIATTLAAGTAVGLAGIASMDRDSSSNEVAVRAKAPSPETVGKVGGIVTSVALNPESSVATVAIDNTTSTTAAPEAPKPVPPTTAPTRKPAEQPIPVTTEAPRTPGEQPPEIINNGETTIDQARTEAAARFKYLKSNQPWATTCAIVYEKDGATINREFGLVQKSQVVTGNVAESYYLIDLSDGATDSPNVLEPASYVLEEGQSIGTKSCVMTWADNEIHIGFPEQ